MREEKHIEEIAALRQWKKEEKANGNYRKAIKISKTILNMMETYGKHRGFI